MERACVPRRRPARSARSVAAHPIRLKIERHCPYIEGRRGRRIVQTAAEDKCIFSGSWFPTVTKRPPVAQRLLSECSCRLPSPSTGLNFLSCKDVEPEKVEELLFHVLGAGLIGADDEVVGEVPSHDLDQTVQETIDEIVAKAIARSVN